MVELGTWLLCVVLALVGVLRPDVVVALLRRTDSRDPQTRFTFSNPSPKTKVPLNGKD